MATFNFKELFSNQFRKDGTLKARNTIENYMRCLHNRYTNIYEFEEKPTSVTPRVFTIIILVNFRIFLNCLVLSTLSRMTHQEVAEVEIIS